MDSSTLINKILENDVINSYQVIDIGGAGNLPEQIQDIENISNSKFVIHKFDPREPKDTTTIPIENNSNDSPDKSDNCIIHPHAIGDSNGTQEFFITEKPECSSFLVPDLVEITNYYSAPADRFRINSKKYFEVRRLDKLNIKPDLIKLDVQGYEYNILSSHKTFILKNKPFLFFEASLTPIYKEQQCFSAITNLLETELKYRIIDIYPRYRNGGPEWMKEIGHVDVLMAPRFEEIVTSSQIISFIISCIIFNKVISLHQILNHPQLDQDARSLLRNLLSSWYHFQKSIYE